MENSSDDEDSLSETLLHQAYVVKPSTSEASWFLDSAASSHMTSDIKFFDIIDSSYTSTVQVANGQACKVYGIGEGNTECVTRNGKTTTLKLTKVLYVPDFDCSLVSIGTLDRLGFYLEIMNKQMVIVTKGNHEITVSDAMGQIYKLRQPEYTFATLAQHPEDCIHRWHARFGHRDPKVI